MKKQNPQDERVVAQRRKINSEAFGIAFIVLLGSIIVQQRFLNAPLEQYAAELICLIGVSVYLIARHLMLGIDLNSDGKWAKFMPLLSSITTGVIFTVIFGILNYRQYAENYEDNIGLFIAALAVYFISMTLLVFAVLSLISYLNKRKQAKIQKRLDDEDEKGE